MMAAKKLSITKAHENSKPSVGFEVIWYFVL
jgi:hypothetical protein